MLNHLDLHLELDRDLDSGLGSGLGRGVILALAVSIAFATLLFGTSVQAESAQRIYPNAESTQPRAVGTKVPSAALLNLDGDPVDLAKLVSESGALLVFYRGGW
jgi:hypothetical protein